jgi:hypothetical protein
MARMLVLLWMLMGCERSLLVQVDIDADQHATVTWSRGQCDAIGPVVNAEEPLPPGNYAIVASVEDACCQVVATGCASVTLPLDSDQVAVELTTQPQPACQGGCSGEEGEGEGEGEGDGEGEGEGEGGPNPFVQHEETFSRERLNDWDADNEQRWFEYTEPSLDVGVYSIADGVGSLVASPGYTDVQNLVLPARRSGETLLRFSLSRIPAADEAVQLTVLPQSNEQQQLGVRFELSGQQTIASIVLGGVRQTFVEAPAFIASTWVHLHIVVSMTDVCARWWDEGQLMPVDCSLRADVEAPTGNLYIGVDREDMNGAVPVVFYFDDVLASGLVE